LREAAEISEIRHIVKKSEFIAVAAPITSESGAIAFISDIRKKHKKARHNCYAYVLPDGSYRRSDDGEPGGTAGQPICDVLLKENLRGVICAVTRYFGGILLGAGGLVRAYSKAASLAIRSSEIIEISETMSPLKITADYAEYDKIAAIVKKAGGVIESEIFADKIEITAAIPSEYVQSAQEELRLFVKIAEFL